MNREELEEAIQYNLDRLEGNYSIEEELEEANKEIDRLNKLLDETRLSELHKEYIINELEKYLNQEIIEWQDASDLWTKAQVQEDRIVLDKLKELKDNK